MCKDVSSVHNRRKQKNHQHMPTLCATVSRHELFIQTNCVRLVVFFGELLMISSGVRAMVAKYKNKQTLMI